MMDQGTHRLHKWVAWTGPVFLVGYITAWAVLGHNIPPPDPRYSAQEFVDNYYLKYQFEIMLGQSCAALFGLVYVPWTCLISVQMQRREKEPLLSYINLTSGILNAWVLAVCPAMWIYAAEIAGTGSPEIVKAIHFVTWYIFDTTYLVASLQGFAVGIFALKYRQEPVLFPPWAGWVAIFMGASFFPLTLVPFFKTGPLAINGLWSFHAVFGAFFVFGSAFSWYVIKETNRIRVSPIQGVGQAISYGAQ